MTAFRRVVSGSVAAWSRLCISLLTQVVSIPIYLRNWDGETLGVWIALQSMVAFTQIVDVTHQNFVDGEFLKVGFKDRKKLFQVFSDSVAIGISIAFLQFLLVLTASFIGLFRILAGVGSNETNIIVACNLFLIGSSFTWLLMGAVGGIAVRLVAPLGYFPRMAWWGVGVSGVAFVTTLPVALAGGELVHVVLAYLISNFFVFFLLCVDLRSIFQKEAISLPLPNWKSGLRNFGFSLCTLTQSVSDYLRQQGVRLFLGPFTGSSSVASFSTMRTGANVALQGMSTISGPVLPELMRFVANKDQSKIEGAFASIWLILMFFLIPCIVTIQISSEWMFAIWIKGKVEFDPFLFSIFSSTVLVFASYQPAAALVRGNNLVRVQVFSSVITTITIIALLIPFVYWFGIRGVALALLIGECVAAVIAVCSAASWMGSQGLKWPWSGFKLVAANVVLTVTLLFYISMARSLNTTVLYLAIIAFSVLLCFYYRSLPISVQLKLQRVISLRNR